MPNILITGAGGLLGSAIARELTNRGLTEGEDFFCLTKDEVNLLDRQEVVDALRFFKENMDCDILYHCAAKVGGVKANSNDNQGFFRDNVIMDDNVLDAALACGYKNLVGILSTCVFPDDTEYPLVAKNIDNGPPHNSNFGYAYAKRLLGYKIKTIREVTGWNWIAVIPTNLYGPMDNFNLENSHLVPALIRKGYNAYKTGGVMEVWGDGSPLRQFVHSSDMAKLIINSLRSWNSGVPKMLVCETEYSIADVVSVIKKYFNLRDDQVVFNSSEPSGQHRKPAKSDVSDYQFISLEDGIINTIEWFLHTMESGEKIRL